MNFIEYKSNKTKIPMNSAKLTKNQLKLSSNLKQMFGKKYVDISYEYDEKILRLKISENTSSIKITGGNIFITGVRKFFNIEEKGLFRAEWIEEDQAIYIYLKEEIKID